MLKKISLFFIVIISLTFFYKKYSNSNELSVIEETKTNSILNQSNLAYKKTPKNNSEKPSLWTDINYDLPISDILEELRIEVERGNPSAIYHMAFIQRKCSNISETEDELNQKIAAIEDSPYKDNLIKDYASCIGFPRKELSQKDIKTYILKAARLGNRSAKLEFGVFAFSDFTTDNVLENAQQILDLKKETMQHLFDVKRAGESASLMRLGMAYEDGEFVEKNNIEAYSYYYAYREVNPNFSSYLLDSIEYRLTDEELNSAIIQGEIYAKCCIQN